MIVYVIQKIGGNKNSPDSLKVMVNYHYHVENMLITIYSNWKQYFFMVDHTMKILSRFFVQGS